MDWIGWGLIVGKRFDLFMLLLALCFLALVPTVVLAAHFDIEKAMVRFWDSDTMYNESVQMAAISGGAPSAKLLFPPVEILSVQSSSLDKTYVKGVDWVFENGMLKLLPGSQAAFMTEAQLYPSVKSENTMDKLGGGYVFYIQAHYLHQQQLAVTYTHAPDLWVGPVPVYQESSLPTVIGKLKKGSAVTIVFYGDSILSGANASGTLSGDTTTASPHMPSWGTLVADNLKRYYTSPIIDQNSSLGGMDSWWGKANVATHVSAFKPDLVVIGFGMNDAGSAFPPDFKKNVQAMMDDVKSKNPAAEFLLVATTLANSETNFEAMQPLFKPVLDELAGPGVVVVDMTGVHRELLLHKEFRDMTGNNINHPNDWLIRWYAQQLTAFLIPKDQPLLTTRKNVALSSFGGIATSSSNYDWQFHPYSVINGDRRGYDYGAGRNGGCWNDKTPDVFPDWVQIDFDREYSIGEIDLFTVQDDHQNPVEPTANLAMSKFGPKDFQVQYWNASAWVTIPGGNVTGNDKVWRQFIFAPVKTPKIRVMVDKAADGYSRITEIEAYSELAASALTNSPKFPSLRADVPVRKFDLQGKRVGARKRVSRKFVFMGR